MGRYDSRFFRRRGDEKEERNKKIRKMALFVCNAVPAVLSGFLYVSYAVFFCYKLYGLDCCQIK